MDVGKGERGSKSDSHRQKLQATVIFFERCLVVVVVVVVMVVVVVGR